jgi:hypothetical protein
LSEAINTISQYKPGWFSEERVLELEPGVLHQSICPCSVLTVDSVSGQSTKGGRLLYELYPRSADAALQWRGPSCPPSDKPFRLREYSVSADGLGLRVYPPVPRGLPEPVYLLVRCVVMPDFEDDEAEIKDDALAVASQWVLYRAKSMDTDSNQMMFYASQDHKESFFVMLGQSLNKRKGPSSVKSRSSS